MNLTLLRIGIRGMSRERSIKCFRAKTQRFDFHHATCVKIRLTQDLGKAKSLTPRPPKLHAKAETCAERSQIYAERSRIYAERSRSSITLSSSHPLTLSPSHPLTLSLILSSSHPLTLSLFHPLLIRRSDAAGVTKSGSPPKKDAAPPIPPPAPGSAPDWAAAGSPPDSYAEHSSSAFPAWRRPSF